MQQHPENLRLFISKLPTSVNRAYGPIPGGKGIYAKPVLKRWKKAAAEEIGEQLAAARLAAPVFSGAVRITIRLPENRRRDADNALKATLDVLKDAGVIVDDRAAYVRGATVEWGDVECTTIDIVATAFAVNTPEPRRKVSTLDWAQKQLAQRGIKVEKSRIHL